MKSCQAILVLI